jgi:hypothetical protein
MDRKITNLLICLFSLACFAGQKTDSIYVTNGVKIDSSLTISKFVGIGTTSPATRLAIQSIAANTNVFQILASGGSNRLLQFINNNSTGDAIIDLGNNSESGSYNSSIVRLNTNGNSYFNGGNAGIGTAAPTCLAQVKGPCRVGALRVDTTTTAPSTGTLALPGSVYGGTTVLLGVPAKWVPVYDSVGTLLGKMPLY